jgi:methionyl-tRNA synthetase
VIDTVKVALAPYLPFSCQRLHAYLHGEGDIMAAGWSSDPPKAGQPLAEPKPLFLKLDPSVAEEEEQRLGK